MSPIFNHHALRGLSTVTLNHLRGIILHLLDTADLAADEHTQLHAALAAIHAVLRNRAAPPRPAPAAPSP